MFTMYLCILSSVFLLGTCLSSPLDNLTVNTNTIAVSGFSSGGCFATQFHTAFSKAISGMGSFSGCPYLSAYVDNDKDILATTVNLAEEGAIDPLENILEDKIFIYQGLVDSIVPWGQAQRIHQFYSVLTADENIHEKSDLQSEHGFPSDSNGGDCDQLNPPLYINNCHYNGALTVMEYTVGMVTDSIVDGHPPPLVQFDQNQFFDNDARGHGMDDNGVVFIPSRCAGGSMECHLHIHFHGCGMESGWLGNNYINNSGFLEAAQQHNVIMVFPQIRHSVLQGNPSGCWDWWGYLGDEARFQYATKEGRQMKGIAKMVERIAGISLL